jgi:hypothetical protein
MEQAKSYRQAGDERHFEFSAGLAGLPYLNLRTIRDKLRRGLLARFIHLFKASGFARSCRSMNRPPAHNRRLF